jgi:uncharacterized membrane protein
LVLEVFKARQSPATSQNAREPAPEAAFAVLADRYARGDLSREEFLERRRDLQEALHPKGAG